MSRPAHVYQVFLRATPEQVWQAITASDWTQRWLHHCALRGELTAGATVHYEQADGTAAVEALVETAEPPHRLVTTWRMLYDPALAAEAPSRVEWLIDAAGEGLTRLRLVHRDLAFSPQTWSTVKDGWAWLLDNLKSVMETGTPLAEWTQNVDIVGVGEVAGSWHRAQGVEANNSVWELLGSTDRSEDDDEDLLRRAYAAAYHWARASGRTPENEARATYMIGKAHLAAGSPDLAERAAQRCLRVVAAAGIADFDLAYAHELAARAAFRRSDLAAAAAHWTAARAVPIANDEDRAIVEGDFADAAEWGG